MEKNLPSERVFGSSALILNACAPLNGVIWRRRATYQIKVWGETSTDQRLNTAPRGLSPKPSICQNNLTLRDVYQPMSEHKVEMRLPTDVEHRRPLVVPVRDM